MKQININIAVNNNILYLEAQDNNATIGTMWDSEVQQLVFTKNESLADYSMMLYIQPQHGEWQEVNLGTANEYTLTNALTQKEQFTLQVAFWTADGYRWGSTNALVFKFAKAPQDGSIPKELETPYKFLLANAVVKAEVIDSNYVFRNADGNEAFTLPMGSGSSTGATVTIGETTTGEAGTSAEVENSGTETDVVLNFKIPQGKTGDQGAAGATPVKGVDYYTEAEQEALVTEITEGVTDSVSADLENLETLYVTSDSWVPTDTQLSTGQSRGIVTSSSVTSVITKGKYSTVIKGAIYCAGTGTYDLIGQTGSGSSSSKLLTARFANSSWGVTRAVIIDALNEDIANITSALGSVTEFVDSYDYKNYYNNIIFDPDKSGISAIGGTTAWGAANTSWTLSVSDEEIVYTYSGSSGNRGFQTPQFVPNAEEKVYAVLDIEELVGSMRVWVWDKTLGDTSFTMLATIPTGTTGEYWIEIDPAYYEVYMGYTNLCLLFSNNGIVSSFKLSRLTVFQSSIYGTDILGVNLDQTLGNINNKLIANTNSVSALESKVDGIISNSYYTPEGLERVLQMKSDGTLYGVPILPANALFIGNSLLFGFWTFGMAATDSNHDYYHYVTKTINNKRAGLTKNKLTGSTWEGYTDVTSQNNWLSGTLLPLLSADLELVVIQLGDNVNTEDKRAVFEEGSLNFLKYVRENAPNARVVWMGSWYAQALMTTVSANCLKTGCTFVDITDLATTDNKAAIGNVVYNDDGTVYTTIDSDGVASHPGDAGMLAIANRLCYKLGITDSEDEIEAEPYEYPIA